MIDGDPWPRGAAARWLYGTYYPLLGALLLTGLAATWGWFGLGPYHWPILFAALVLLLPLLILGMFQRVGAALLWLARGMWGSREQPLWLLGALVAFGLWLAVCIAIGLMSLWYGGVFIALSLSAIADLYHYRHDIAAWLRRLSARPAR